MASAHMKMSRPGLSGHIRLIQKAQQKSLTNNAVILLRAPDAPDSIDCIPLGSGRSGRSASSTKLEGNLPALEASLPAHSQDVASYECRCFVYTSLPTRACMYDTTTTHTEREFSEAARRHVAQPSTAQYITPYPADSQSTKRAVEAGRGHRLNQRR